MKRVHTVWFIAILLVVAATGSVAVAKTTVRTAARTTHPGHHYGTGGKSTTTTGATVTTRPVTTTTAVRPSTTTTTATLPVTTPTTASAPSTTTPTTPVATTCVGVPMLSGQADIDAHGTGTTFCLSGTHSWTLHPKSGDVLRGGVLDGGNTTAFAVIADVNVTNVTVADMEIRNYTIGGGNFRGAITVQDASETGWRLNNLQVHDIGSNNNGAGVELGNGWVVTGGRYYDNRQEGLTNGEGQGFTLHGVESDHNDFTDHTYTTRAHSCGDEGGGMKFVASNITIDQNSYFHHNACSGVWSDLSSTNIVITNSRFVDNWEGGIFVEISGAATISHNTVTGNGFHMQNANNNGCGWGWGGGITLSTSGQTHTSNGPIDISFNNVVGNCNGITGVDQYRDEHGCSIAPTCELAHLRIHDNTIVGSTAANAVNNLGYFSDDGDDLRTHDIIFGTGNTVTNMNNCQFSC
jgi:parallel beta-helix repeat protein